MPPTAKKGGSGKKDPATPGKKGAPAKQASVAKLHKVSLDALTEMSLADQLRIQLHANAITVVELFKSWDADGSGSIARGEFHEGVLRLGYNATDEAIDTVFDSFDGDHGGELEFIELKKALQRSAADVEKELRQKNAEMRARVLSAGPKTDTHGVEITHGGPIPAAGRRRRPSAAGGGDAAVVAVGKLLSSELCALETTVDDLQLQIARAEEQRAAAQAEAAAAVAAAAGNSTPSEELRRVREEQHRRDTELDDVRKSLAQAAIAASAREEAAEARAVAAEARAAAAEARVAEIERRLTAKPTPPQEVAPAPPPRPPPHVQAQPTGEPTAEQWATVGESKARKQEAALLGRLLHAGALKPVSRWESHVSSSR